MAYNKKSYLPSKRSGSSKFKRFGKDFIKAVVKEVEEGLSRREACDKYGMSSAVLYEWIVKYESDAFRASRRPYFTTQQKRTIVRAVREGRMTIKEAELVYKVTGRDTVRRWVRKSTQENAELASMNKPGKKSPPAELSDQQKDLQKELADAKLKIAALETMIDIAEEQLKINIRKKPGAKQSQK
jgi:transposase